MNDSITVGTLINWLEGIPLDLEVYASIPHKLESVEIVEISPRHSKDWGVPQKFVKLNIV